MQAEIYSVMYRLVHKYGWNLGLTRGLINRRFGTNYTTDELKELYRIAPAQLLNGYRIHWS